MDRSEERVSAIRRPAILVVALALVAGATALFLTESTAPRPTRPLKKETSSTRPLPAVGMIEESRREVVAAPTDELRELPPTAADPKGSGGVTGILSDDAGQPLFGHALHFASEDAPLHYNQASADEFGIYRLDALPAGQYSVRYLGEMHAALTRGSVLTGQVEILPDQLVTHHVSIGRRAVLGSLDLPEIPHTQLGLELRLRNQPERLIAVSTVKTGELLLDDTNKQLSPWEEPDPNDIDSSLAGQFRFDGLLPGDYVLRIILDTEGKLFLERQIDLVTEDLILPHEVLTPDEFVRASLARDPELILNLVESDQEANSSD